MRTQRSDIGEADSYSTFGEFDVAGLMGLAFPSLASSNGTPWWLNALDQFESPEFSFYFAE
jgi:hypothetical protein